MFAKLPLRRKKGFGSWGYTLIEILVVVSIMSILFTIGYASYRDFARRQSLISSVRKMRGDISQAREKATTGEKPDGCAILLGYNVRFSSGSYNLESVCSNATTVAKTISLPSNVTSSLPETNPIYFKVLSKGTNITGETTITLTQTESGKTESVIITAEGEVK